MTTTNRTTLQTGDQRLIDGLTKHKALVTALPIGGKNFTCDEAIAVVQARIDASNATLTSKASAKAELQAERAGRAQTKAFVSSLRQVIRSMFGASPDLLADFGLGPHKSRKANPQKKVDAAKRAKATRVLRHTMGKKQKAAIKATGPLPTATPANEPAAGNAPAAAVTAPNAASAGAATPQFPTAAPAGGTAPAASPTATPAPHTQTPSS
jgi:hypothetical protein